MMMMCNTYCQHNVIVTLCMLINVITVILIKFSIVLYCVNMLLVTMNRPTLLHSTILLNGK